MAHANAGVPMLALAWPAEWLALLPIILLEAKLIQSSIHVPFKQMIWPMTKANFISTLVGVPVAWLVMLAPLMLVSYGYYLVPTGVEMPSTAQYLLFPLTAAWVSGSSAWQIYFAFVVLAIPFCLISIFLERGVLIRAFPEIEKKLIHSSVIRANIWSYMLLSLLAIAFPLLA